MCTQSPDGLETIINKFNFSKKDLENAIRTIGGNSYVFDSSKHHGKLVPIEKMRNKRDTAGGVTGLSRSEKRKQKQHKKMDKEMPKYIQNKRGEGREKLKEVLKRKTSKDHASQSIRKKKITKTKRKSKRYSKHQSDTDMDDQTQSDSVDETQSDNGDETEDDDYQSESEDDESQNEDRQDNLLIALGNAGEDASVEAIRRAVGQKLWHRQQEILRNIEKKSRKRNERSRKIGTYTDINNNKQMGWDENGVLMKSLKKKPPIERGSRR